jgi:hypothetical protein
VSSHFLGCPFTLADICLFVSQPTLDSGAGAASAAAALNTPAAVSLMFRKPDSTHRFYRKAAPSASVGPPPAMSLDIPLTS